MLPVLQALMYWLWGRRGRQGGGVVGDEGDMGEREGRRMGEGVMGRREM